MSIADPLYHRIRDFAIDSSPAALSFAGRLARENGWQRGYADRVIAEYKRFVYLCATSPEPLTPSEQVDQAWHLHMVYTHSYWTRMCGEVLLRPLHHEPTTGGPGKRALYRAQYERTKETYRRVFGEDPPGDIWPAAEVRFGVDLKSRRVNTASHWILRKPWCRPTEEQAQTGRPSMGALALLAGVCAFLLIGCDDTGDTLFACAIVGIIVVPALFGRKDKPKRHTSSCSIHRRSASSASSGSSGSGDTLVLIGGDTTSHPVCDCGAGDSGGSDSDGDGGDGGGDGGCGGGGCGGGCS